MAPRPAAAPPQALAPQPAGFRVALALPAGRILLAVRRRRGGSAHWRLIARGGDAVVLRGRWLSLAAIPQGLCAVALLSLLPFSVKMAVSPLATLGGGARVASSCQNYRRRSS